MRKKLIRYNSLSSFPNVYDAEPARVQEILFGSTKPITLELACGRGEYTNGLAQQFPTRNFIGVDIKGERLWQGARRSQELLLKNTGFVRASIDRLEYYFAAESVEEIWLIHPDPQPKRERRRLTHPKYLLKYNQLLQTGGQLHLKTDDKNLFDYSASEISGSKSFTILQSTTDLHRSKLLKKHFDIVTNFEQKALFKSKPIYYLVATKSE